MYSGREFIRLMVLAIIYGYAGEYQTKLHSTQDQPLKTSVAETITKPPEKNLNTVFIFTTRGQQERVIS